VPGVEIAYIVIASAFYVASVIFSWLLGFSFGVRNCRKAVAELRERSDVRQSEHLRMISELRQGLVSKEDISEKPLPFRLM
jgi:hypothetical protein